MDIAYVGTSLPLTNSSGHHGLNAGSVFRPRMIRNQGKTLSGPGKWDGGRIDEAYNPHPPKRSRVLGAMASEGDVSRPIDDRKGIGER